MDELTMRVIRKAIGEKVEEFIKEIDCPNCKKFTTAIRAGCLDEPVEGEEEGWSVEVWRCQLCLKLFKETLIEVKEE